MKKILIALLASVEVFASAGPSEQADANDLYYSVGTAIVNSVDLKLKSEALIALPNQALTEEGSKKIWNCEMGLISNKIPNDFPFGIGRKSRCVNGFKALALALDRVMTSPAFDYLNRVVDLPVEADQALQKLANLKIETGMNTCNAAHIRFLNGIKNRDYTYRIWMRDRKIGLQMDTEEAVRFLNSIQKTEGDLVTYLDNAGTKETAIRRGMQLHLALKTLRASVNNSLILEDYVRNASINLQKGCE